MDSWLDDQEVDQLIKQLNPDLVGKEYDANWEQLKRSHTTSRYDFDRTVKTKTPTLLDFESHYSFLYRRSDGAHWHTELRDIDTEFHKQGLTSEQRRLKDNINTIFALKQFGSKCVWITPINKQNNCFDPTYQLLKIDDAWFCCIQEKIYAVSNTRTTTRGYTEHTFSTKNNPLFTIESTEKILDRII